VVGSFAANSIFMKSCCQEVTMNMPEKTSKQKSVIKWFKRIGIAGFLFFLLKGLAWVFFGAAIVKYFGCN